jgi:NADPH:quinone reductase-like Zn-dependent oxidoreductase
LEEKIAATRAFANEILPHMEAGRIRPVVDREFAFDDIVDAHRYMETNANFGKIVVNVSS